MRKITQQVVNAFMNGDNLNVGNTRVESTNGASKMFLHNNLIAVRINKAIKISNAGWESNTTKERLNGILDHLNKGRIYQKDFTWYWKDGIPFESDTLNIV
jgi:hypothetical protein